MWQDLKRCEGPMHGIVKLFTDDHEIIISTRGETISKELNQSFQIKNNPIKLCLKYCPAFQNSLHQQIYFQSAST